MLDITKQVKEIFGDIVVSAYSKNGIKYKHHEKYHINYDNDDFSDFDADTITIQFSNGSKIEIGNSEWGWIKKI